MAWTVLDSESIDKVLEIKTENDTLSQFILFIYGSARSPTTTNTFYLRRWYSDLPPHNYVLGSAKFWYSNNLLNEARPTVEITIGEYKFNSLRPEKPCLILNLSHRKSDFEYIYFGEVHDDSSIYFSIKIQIPSNSSAFSFGLRELTFHLSDDIDQNLTALSQGCASNCNVCLGPKPSQCLSCSPEAIWRGSECNRCHSNCKSCSGPTEHECLSCDYGLYNYQNGSCLKICEWPFRIEIPGYNCLKACKSDEYIWHSKQSCTPNCFPPLLSSTGSHGMQVCQSPCSNKQDFLYKNGSCLADCPAPLQIELDRLIETRFCTNGCESRLFESYLYPDRSCGNNCLSPLQIRIEPIAKYCESPCRPQGGYIYSNGSCISSCPFPLSERFSFGILTCSNPCTIKTEFLYPDQICLKECPKPMRIRTESIAKYCESPCHSEAEYLYNNGSCISTCPAPFLAEFDAGIKLCKNPCKSTSDFLFANRSCLKECPAPLKIRYEPIINYCENPCHSTNFYLYQDGSCHEYCRTPLKIRERSGVKYCQAQCDLNREYILSDGSCVRDCPSPMVKKAEASIGTYCVSPCESADSFVSNNGSCLLDCPAFFAVRREHGVKYCISPCLLDQYYFVQNNSCIDRCLLEVKLEGGGKLCQNPCQNGNEFLYDDQSCYEGCSSPLIVEEGKCCKSPCLKENKYLNSDGNCQEACVYPLTIVKKGPYQICILQLNTAQIVQINGMKEVIKVSNTISEIGGVLSTLINAGDPTSILMLPLLGMFEILGNTEMLLPSNTELILNSGQIQEIFDKRVLVMGFVCVVSLLVSGISKFSQVLTKCDFALRWNCLISLFISFCGDLLFSSLTTTLHQIKSILCIFLTLLISCKIFNVVRKRELETPPRWKFLFEIFEPNGRFFVLIFMLRVILLNFICRFLSHHPQIQAVLFVSLSFGMCWYLVRHTPIQRTMNKTQFLINEIALLFYNFILAVLVVVDTQDGSFKNILGQLMNILYFMTSIITAIIIIFRLLSTIYSQYHSLKGASSRSSHIQLSELDQDSSRGIDFESSNQLEIVSERGNNSSDSETEDATEPCLVTD